MVLEKQDSGICLTQEGMDYQKLSQENGDTHVRGHQVAGDDQDHVPLHKTVCCSLCR